MIGYGTDYDADGQPVIRATVEEHRGHLRMAERVVREHGDDLRHVRGLGWHVWDGARWAEDEDEKPTRMLIQTLKNCMFEAIALDKDSRDALMADVRRAESSQGLSGVLSVSGKLLPISLSHSALDACPDLFNTPAGTIDLTDCTLRGHRRADHITRVSGVSLDGQCPDDELWATFLERILPDPDVRAFIQRLIGYAMLGQVREHVMPIFTGTGANGKGTFRDAVSHAFGDYAHEVDPELLMESKHARHGTFKMQLRGRRLVFCSETEKGRRFAEATMKRLVGGDPIEANRMHKDPITFQPSHTLIMLTNHLPNVSGDDPAVWRRLLVVPFDVVIPDAERDNRLGERLKAAAPAVLRWAYEGWQEYQRIGLAPPAVVMARTEAYRLDSDTLGRFLAERTLSNPNCHVRARDLFSAFQGWCADTKERGGTEKEFAASMTSRGFEKTRSNGVRAYRGIGLLNPEDDEAAA